MICYFVYIASLTGRERAMFVLAAGDHPDQRVLDEAGVCFMVEDISQTRYKFFRIDGHLETADPNIIKEESLIGWIEAGMPRKWNWEKTLDPNSVLGKIQRRQIKPT